MGCPGRGVYDQKIEKEHANTWNVRRKLDTPNLYMQGGVLSGNMVSPSSLSLVICTKTI